MPENATSAPGDASNNELAALSDSDLDQKIGAKIQMIGSALEGRDRAIEGRDRAVEEVERCKKSAVLSAWRLGQFLIEKKSRLTHGGWLTWLDSCPRVSSSSAATAAALHAARSSNFQRWKFGSEHPGDPSSAPRAGDRQAEIEADACREDRRAGDRQAEDVKFAVNPSSAPRAGDRQAEIEADACREDRRAGDRQAEDDCREDRRAGAGLADGAG